jgi:hypothetical protein
MPTRLRVFYSLFTAALLLIPVVALYSDLAKRTDIRCTPPPNAPVLTESADRGQRLTPLLIYSAAIGGGLVLILVTATGRLAYRGERVAITS